MERAYRRREGFANAALAAAIVPFLVAAHYTWSFAFFPLIGIVVAGAFLLHHGPTRLFFPHAWHTFDAPRPSPALEEETRDLARCLGVRPSDLRLVPKEAKRPRVEWRGRTMVVNVPLRDLPPGERRFLLARSVLLVPDAADLFVRYTAWPLFYLSFALGCFERPSLGLAFGALNLACLAINAVQRTKAAEAADVRAVSLVERDAALAYWRREEALGSPRAKRAIAELRNGEVRN